MRARVSWMVRRRGEMSAANIMDCYVMWPRHFESLMDAVRSKLEFEQFPEGANVPGVNAELSLNGARSFDPSRITGWQEHLPRINGQLRDHPYMAQDLIEAGYETDDRWTEQLEGVGYYTQEYKDEPPSRMRSWEASLRFWWKTRRYLRALQK